MTVEQTYVTALYVNNPMEPHTSTAVLEGDQLTVYDSTQGVHQVRETIADLFGLPPEQVRVVSPHVGGGFGSKGLVHAPLVVAVMAARHLRGRAVSLALTRQQMFSLVGYRTPTIQRVALGASADGRLDAVACDVIELSSRVKEFAEQTAVPTRVLYAAPNRRTTHRLAALDVPVPTWMRAPGECPGTFGIEVAMDELAVACGVDPVELRARNDTEVEPESGRPFSSRNLVACLRRGAERFGWSEREPGPRTGRDGRWLLGTGVAAATYPVHHPQGSVATVARRPGPVLRRVHRRRRHRDRHVDGADPGGVRRARCARRPRPSAHRRHRASEGHGRRRIVGDDLLGLRHRRRRRGVPDRARRPP